MRSGIVCVTCVARCGKAPAQVTRFASDVREEGAIRLLDLFCGAGGCAVGYQRAGFTEITGVDINPQPNYPFRFIQADAMVYATAHAHEYDAIHASPPCQGYSRMRHITKKEYPLMIEDVRTLLIAAGRPYVIENVEGAPLLNATMLCGTMFSLKVFRHRLFETSFFMLAPPHIKHSLFGKACPQGRPPTDHEQYMTITGCFSGIAAGKQAMGIDWMNRYELTQSVPPAYTEYIGRHLIEHINVTCERTKR